MAGSSDKKLQTADILFGKIDQLAAVETDPARLEQLANAFALVANSQGGREKSQGGRIM